MLTKRKLQIARSKRLAVLGSTAFKEWYEERRKVGNPPGDPYRAYMIDLSLRAELENREKWKKQPNRLDLSQVDYPWTHAPAPKRRLPARKQEYRRKPAPTQIQSPTLPPLGIGGIVTKDIRNMAATYHMPEPKTYMDPGGGSSHYSPQTKSITVKLAQRTLDPNYKWQHNPLGKGWQAVAVGRHETGHYIHYEAEKPFLLENRYAMLPHKYEYKRVSNETLRIESVAWRLAREYTKKQIAAGKENKSMLPKVAWLGRSKIDTYIKHYGPFNPKFKGEW